MAANFGVALGAERREECGSVAFVGAVGKRFDGWENGQQS